MNLEGDKRSQVNFLLRSAEEEGLLGRAEITLESNDMWTNITPPCFPQIRIKQWKHFPNQVLTVQDWALPCLVSSL